jgi:hypothetical protein
MKRSPKLSVLFAAFGVAVLLVTGTALSAQGPGRAVVRVVFANVTFRNLYTVTVAGHICHATCSVSVKRGSIVELSATPPPNHDTQAPYTGGYFSQWSRGCVGSAPVCLIAVNSPTTVTADFEPYWGELLIAETGPGIVAGGAGARWYPLGTTVRLLAVAKEGGKFGNWEGACSTVRANVCTVEVGKSGLHADGRAGYSDENAAAVSEVSAVFGRSGAVRGLPTLTVSSDGPVVTSTPAGIDCRSGSSDLCRASFPAGTAVKLSTAGLAQWQGGCYREFNDSACHLILGGPLRVQVSPATQSAGSSYSGGDLPLDISGHGSVMAVGASLTLVSTGQSACTKSCRCAKGCECRKASCDFHTSGPGAVTLTAKPAPGNGVQWGQQCRSARTRLTCTLKSPDPGAPVWASFGPQPPKRQ